MATSEPSCAAGKTAALMRPPLRSSTSFLNMLWPSSYMLPTGWSWPIRSVIWAQAGTDASATNAHASRATVRFIVCSLRMNG